MASSKPGANVTASTAEREIYAERVFDAPRELVWKMFTEPAHISKWWGPIGFTTTTSEMNVKPGGVWQHVMHGPDGRDSPNKIVYVEVVKPESIVYDHVSYPLFRSTVLLEEEGTKTAVSMRMVFESAELRDKVDKQHKAVEGLSQTIGRLGEHLAAYPVNIERTFDAPMETVWKAITEIEQMKKWFMGELHSFKAEVGFETEFMVRHEGKEYPHLWKVIEVEPGRKYSVEWRFKGYSGSSLATMELFAEAGGTKLRLTHAGLESYPRGATELSRANFASGWSSLINEKLPDYLAKS